MPKHVPMRDWNSSSYCLNGRAASSLMNDGDSTVIEGEPINPTPQIPRDRGRGGAPSWDEWTKARTQGGS
jgi:hypothetical protein